MLLSCSVKSKGSYTLRIKSRLSTMICKASRDLVSGHPFNLILPPSLHLTHVHSNLPELLALLQSKLVSSHLRAFALVLLPGTLTLPDTGKARCLTSIKVLLKRHPLRSDTLFKMTPPSIQPYSSSRFQFGS